MHTNTQRQVLLADTSIAPVTAIWQVTVDSKQLTALPAGPVLH